MGIETKMVRGNSEKYYRYQKAHERLSLALKHQFYIEAAMICESLIADRLHSHVHWRVHEARLHDIRFFGKYSKCLEYELNDVIIGKAAFVPFGVLVGMYAKCIHDDHRDDHPIPPKWTTYKRNVSPAVLKYWAEERNAVAHGAVKTHPTLKSYQDSFEQFQDRAERCAISGADLVRLVGNWDAAVRRSQIRQTK